jgi:hypothetical protein
MFFNDKNKQEQNKSLRDLFKPTAEWGPFLNENSTKYNKRVDELNEVVSTIS